MEFFNKKEEVIDLQLTQYGKHLLSMGRFKPVYYAFYDDGILYDSEYGGFTEAQNEAKNRIQNNTPNLKTQYVFNILLFFPFSVRFGVVFPFKNWIKNFSFSRLFFLARNF